VDIDEGEVRMQLNGKDGQEFHVEESAGGRRKKKEETRKLEEQCQTKVVFCELHVRDGKGPKAGS